MAVKKVAKRVARVGGPPVYISNLSGKIKRADIRKAVLAVLDDKAKAKAASKK